MLQLNAAGALRFQLLRTFPDQSLQFVLADNIAVHFRHDLIDDRSG